MTRRRAIYRRLTATAAVALALPLALAACGGGGNDAAGGSGSGSATRLTVQDTFVTEPGKSFYQKELDACGKEAGVTIDHQAIPGASIIAKVLQQASSRTLPDVLSIDNPDVQQIAASGALAPLSDFGISADGYSQGVTDANSYQGKLYGLQPTTNTLALFYNKDILAKAGITPPTTWAELQTDAKKLTSGSRYGLAFSAINTYEGTWQFLPFMWSNGGDEKDIATPQTAEALQLWVDLVKSGSASKSVVTWGQEDVNDQFMAGKAAMMINGPWQFPVLAAKPDVHYGVASLPVKQAGAKVVGPLGGATWVVPQTGDKDKQAKAAKVVQCLNSDTNMLNDAKTNDAVPTKTALGQQLVATEPQLKAFVDEVPSLRSRTGELGAQWTKAATAIYTAVQSALTGGAQPMEALQQAQHG